MGKRHMPMMPKRILIAGSAVTLFLLNLASPANAISPVVEPKKDYLAAHRAVYDLNLESARSNANISDVNGRMVYEVTGTKCEGYLVRVRFLLTITDSKGTSFNRDVSFSSWEDGEAKRFRFNSSQYDNDRLSKTTEIDAARKEAGEGIMVNIKKPKRSKVKFEEKTYFPTEHTKLVIDAAVKGQQVVTAPLYDGSENGNTLYETTAFIGKPIKEDAVLSDKNIKNIAKLKGIPAWPISISFFDHKKSNKQDLLPDYEISFNLYKNGVSTNHHIDYGDFILNGKMKEIEFLQQSPCPKTGN